MLDLRHATTSGPIPEKWFTILNTKNSKFLKPQIKVSFCVTPKKNLIPQQIATANSTINNTTTPKPIHSAPSKYIHVTENSQNGFYQVGSGNTLWDLWITISFAENLTSLLPINYSTENSNDYYFFYSFLGKNIATQKFSSLTSPNFPAERVSIKLSGLKNDIEQFFYESGKFSIYLCQNDQVLGSSNVDLLDIFKTKNDSLNFIIESNLPLYDNHKNCPIDINGNNPGIGLSIALNLASQAQSPKKLQPTQNREIYTEKENPPSPIKNNSNLKNNQNSHDVSLVHMKESDAIKPKRAFLDQRDRHYTDIPTRFQDLPDNPTGNNWHQYRFSIDLRSVRDFQNQSGNLFFKYSYEPFSTASPVITQPPLPVTKSITEHILPQSFCAFEFVMSPEKIASTFNQYPFVIEMWDQDKNSKSVPLGICTINLYDILYRKCKTKPDSPEIFSLDSYFPVTVSGMDTENIKKIAEIKIIFALEDFGIIEEPINETAEKSTGPIFSAHIPNSELDSVTNKLINLGESNEKQSIKIKNSDLNKVKNKPIEKEKSTSPPKSHPIEETEEYKVALDLEIYRHEEEKRFLEHLKMRETDLVNKLVNEFQNREIEREAAVKAKIEQVTLIEKEFKKLKNELELRERKLKQAEEDLTKRRIDMERQVEYRIEEARDTTRRLQEEFKHRVEIEKQKTADVESQKLRILKDRDELEHRLKNTEKEFSEFKRGIGMTNEASLQAEINILIKENSKLEKLVSELSKSKKHYKAEWHASVARLAAINKQRLKEEARIHENERQELQRLKIQFRTQEEKENITSERKSLQTLNETLDLLAKQGLPAQKVDQPNRIIPSVDSGRKLSSEKLAEVERLSKERDSLLESGYSQDDRIIRELNYRISEMQI